MSWKGFNYAPVQAVVLRLQARKARTERKNFLRFLRQASKFDSPLAPTCQDLAERLQRLHDSPRYSATFKQALFAQLLDDYADAVMAANPQLDTEGKPAEPQPVG